MYEEQIACLSDTGVTTLDHVESIAGEQPFKLLGRVMKAHARVIWACSWAPDDRSFATGARDSLVKVWSLSSGSEGMAPCQDFPITRLPLISDIASLAFVTWRCLMIPIAKDQGWHRAFGRQLLICQDAQLCAQVHAGRLELGPYSSMSTTKTF